METVTYVPHPGNSTAERGVQALTMHIQGRQE